MMNRLLLTFNCNVFEDLVFLFQPIIKECYIKLDRTEVIISSNGNMKSN
jgi:hypothetical protein